jgi:hypothetical protein
MVGNAADAGACRGAFGDGAGAAYAMEAIKEMTGTAPAHAIRARAVVERIAAGRAKDEVAEDEIAEDACARDVVAAVDGEVELRMAC